MASKSISLVVLGTDLLCSTLLSPFLKDVVVGEDNEQISVKWAVAVYGVHAFDVAMVRKADGIIVVYSGDHVNNFIKCKEMTAPLSQFCPPDVPVLGIGVVRNQPEFNSALTSQARHYFGCALRCSMVNFACSDKEACHSLMRQFVLLAATRVSQPRVYVRAICDNDTPNSYEFKTDDVFVLETPTDESGWATGNYLGYIFMFADHYVEVVKDPKKQRETIRSLAIPRTHKAKGLKDVFIVYSIELETNKNSHWTSNKRFSELFDFYTHLLSAYPEARLPPFPKKSLLSSREIIEQRRVQIETCLRAALDDPAISTSGIVDQFLELDKFVSTQPRRSTVTFPNMKSRPAGHVSTLSSTPEVAIEEQDEYSSDYKIDHCHKIVQALYDFEPREEGELGFRYQDLIEVYAELDSGWAYGSVLKLPRTSSADDFEVFGTFPSIYASPLSPETALPNSETVSQYLAHPKTYQLVTLTPGDDQHFPQLGDTLEIHYSGYFLDGMEFDTSFGTEGLDTPPLSLKLGNTQPSSYPEHPVLANKGLHNALKQMSKGQRAILTIFPNPQSAPSAGDLKVPAGSVLNFDLEVLSITSAPVTPTIALAPVAPPRASPPPVVSAAPSLSPPATPSPAPPRVPPGPPPASALSSATPPTAPPPPPPSLSAAITDPDAPPSTPPPPAPVSHLQSLRDHAHNIPTPTVPPVASGRDRPVPPSSSSTAAVAAPPPTSSPLRADRSVPPPVPAGFQTAAAPPTSGRSSPVSPVPPSYTFTYGAASPAAFSASSSIPTPAPRAPPPQPPSALASLAAVESSRPAPPPVARQPPLTMFGSSGGTNHSSPRNSPRVAATAAAGAVGSAAQRGTAPAARPPVTSTSAASLAAPIKPVPPTYGTAKPTQPPASSPVSPHLPPAAAAAAKPPTFSGATPSAVAAAKPPSNPSPTVSVGTRGPPPVPAPRLPTAATPTPAAAATAATGAGKCDRCNCAAFTKNPFKPNMCKQCTHDVSNHH